MSSASSSRVLVNHKYAEDGHLPSEGEIIILPLSQDLFRPGSNVTGNNRNIPPQSHHAAVVLDIVLKPFQSVLIFTVLPIPTYSAPDPTSELSLTSWLLSKAANFQWQHIPVLYEHSPQPQPTLTGFGDPLELGGWKNSQPSWVLAVPQVTELEYTTTFKCFEPAVKLNKDELRRLKTYSGLSPPCSSITLPQAARSSLAFYALYVNDTVKWAFVNIGQSSTVIDSGSDNDEDDNEDWEDRMDPITFARYYATSNTHLAKIVQEHDQKMRIRLDQEIKNWVEGVQAEILEDDAL